MTDKMKSGAVNLLQEAINAIVDQELPIELFQKAAEIAGKVKNTFDIKCPKCKSDQVYEKAVQLRSADEVSSLIYECLTCGNKWRVG